MPAPISGLRESALPSMAAASPQGSTADRSTDRRQEFDSILSHSLPRFRRIAMRLLRNPEDAEDAVQDAMLSAHRHIASFDGRSQMSTWIMSIVINAVRMQIRRRSHAPRCRWTRTPETAEGRSRSGRWIQARLQSSLCCSASCRRWLSG
jgi:DNA-directed RNA polymerase specialized sigma24 family protein